MGTLYGILLEKRKWRGISIIRIRLTYQSPLHYYYPRQHISQLFLQWLTGMDDGSWARSKFGSFDCSMMNSSSFWVPGILCAWRSCTCWGENVLRFFSSILGGLSYKRWIWGEARIGEQGTAKGDGRMGKTQWACGLNLARNAYLQKTWSIILEYVGVPDTSITIKLKS